tara:strand:+ start:145 stop:264 length:120 start_codon:yes stop_codon:yes gene_type:complete
MDDLWLCDRRQFAASVAQISGEIIDQFGLSDTDVLLVPV